MCLNFHINFNINNSKKNPFSLLSYNDVVDQIKFIFLNFEYYYNKKPKISIKYFVSQKCKIFYLQISCCFFFHLYVDASTKKDYLSV